MRCNAALKLRTFARVSYTASCYGAADHDVAADGIVDPQYYTYDNLNRLTDFSSPGVYDSPDGSQPAFDQSWSLDAVGNWKNSSSGSTVTERTNSAQNQVTSVGGEEEKGTSLNMKRKRGQKRKRGHHSIWN